MGRVILFCLYFVLFVCLFVHSSILYCLQIMLKVYKLEHFPITTPHLLLPKTDNPETIIYKYLPLPPKITPQSASTINPPPIVAVCSIQVDRHNVQNSISVGFSKETRAHLFLLLLVSRYYFLVYMIGGLLSNLWLLSLLFSTFEGLFCRRGERGGRDCDSLFSETCDGEVVPFHGRKRKQI